MKKRVLLLGAGGQLGQLLEKSAPSTIDLHSFGAQQLDITSPDVVTKAVELANPDVVVNAAAYTQVDKAESEPGLAFGVNSQGPANLVEAVPKETRILHVSTDFVFDGESRQPYSPDHPTAPLGVYGQSKREGEIRLFEQRPDSIVVRTAWLYSSEGNNFLNTILRLMKERHSLQVVSDQLGTPTSAHMLAYVLWSFVDKSSEVEGGIYHWTDGGECSWYDFAVAIQEEALALGLLDSTIPISPITTADYPTPAARPAYSVLDKRRTQDVLGIEGRPWREALIHVLQQKLRKQ